MIRSMTGYARLEKTTEWGTLSWELRSINHRYLELAFRLPEEFRHLEPEFRKRVSPVIRRGKVDAGLRFVATDAAQNSLTINTEMLDSLVACGDQLKARSADIEPLRAIDLLRWPGLLSEGDSDLEPLLAAAGELLDEALANLSRNRGHEGERISEMLTSRCEAMAVLVDQVRAKMPDVMDCLGKRLRDRVGQLVNEIDNDRIEMELAVLAQKFDVDEELDRLNSHLTEVGRTITRSDPVGRRLDFLMQELNREANTLSSKSQDTDVTRAAVELKVLIEQMREQVQNIE